MSSHNIVKLSVVLNDIGEIIEATPEKHPHIALGTHIKVVTSKYGSGAVLKPIIVRNRLKNVLIIHSGSGYNIIDQPYIVIENKSNGYGALATAVVKNGEIQKILVKNSGKKYSQQPDVIIHGNGSNAIAYIKNGKVTKVSITENDTKYTSPPHIFIISREQQNNSWISDSHMSEMSWGVKFQGSSLEISNIDISADGEAKLILRSPSGVEVFNSDVNGKAQFKNIDRLINTIEIHGKLKKINVTGSPGKSCDYYHAMLKNNDPIIRKLYIGCDQKEKNAAKKFDTVAKSKVKLFRNEIQKLREKMLLVKKSKKHDEEVANIGKKFGLPPPPPEYTDDEVHEMEKQHSIYTSHIKRLRSMSTSQKALCVADNKNIVDLQHIVDLMVIQTTKNPFLQPKLERAMEKLEKIQEKYKLSCF